MSWQLRRATPDDLDAIMAIETSTFINDAWSPAMLRGDLGNTGCYYLVAFPPEHPDRVEAYAGLLCPRGAAEGDIQTIAVIETARKHGLGRTLMQALTNEARRRGAHELFLEVRADNPAAQQLYVSLGFELVGVRRAYYQPDGVDAQVMRLVIPDPVTSLAMGQQ